MYFLNFQNQTQISLFENVRPECMEDVEEAMAQYFADRQTATL